MVSGIAQLEHEPCGRSDDALTAAVRGSYAVCDDHQPSLCARGPLPKFNIQVADLNNRDSDFFPCSARRSRFFSTAASRAAARSTRQWCGCFYSSPARSPFPARKPASSANVGRSLGQLGLLFVQDHRIGRRQLGRSGRAGWRTERREKPRVKGGVPKAYRRPTVACVARRVVRPRVPTERARERA